MLIEIEGPSGAGKTSLVASLCATRQLAGRITVNAAEAERTTDDLGWRTGALMREIGQARRPLDPTEAVLLYGVRTAARARLIAGLNDDHTMVFCDRLRLSLDVQTRLAGLSPPVARPLIDLAVRQLSPYLVVLVDVAHHAHTRRLAVRGHDPLPAVAFDLIREHFHAAFNEFAGAKLLIDTTSLTADEVHRAVLDRLPLARAAG